jgi:hypothetical protein
MKNDCFPRTLKFEMRLERHCGMMARGKVHSEVTRPENDCDLRLGLGCSNLIVVQN